MGTKVTDRPAASMTFNAHGGKGLFTADRTAPSAARKWVASYFEAQDRADVVEDVKLLVSELVTNALRQLALFVVDGEDVICVRIVRGPKYYRVEVYDGNPEGIPTDPQLSDVTSKSGRGLPLVGAFAAQWGWTPYAEPDGDEGKCVWFTILRLDENRRPGER